MKNMDHEKRMYKFDWGLMASHGDSTLAWKVRSLIENGYAVEIEPCEHGNYVRHLLTILENMERVWCDGKPKGNDE